MPPMNSPPPRRRGTKAAAAAALVAGSFLLHGAAAFVPSPAGRSARWVRLRPGAPAELAAPLGYADGSVGAYGKRERPHLLFDPVTGKPIKIDNSRAREGFKY